jgi:hypothetical protein
MPKLTCKGFLFFSVKKAYEAYLGRSALSSRVSSLMSTSYVGSLQQLIAILDLDASMTTENTTSQKHIYSK